MCEKRKNGAECIRGIKNVNLNKIQRSNERVSQDKGQGAKEELTITR